LIIRALRRRRGWRQSDLADRSRVSQPTISVVERGHLDTLSIRTIRRVLAALDARIDLDVRWRGGALDRTLDERHAQLVGAVVAILVRYGWTSEIEVTYSIYGERGSIDILAFHPPTGSLLVIEVKTELASIEETLRRLDEKHRLGRRIAREQLGWTPATTSRLIVLSEGPTNRSRVVAHAAVLDAALPSSNVEVRRWLRRPHGTLSGRWFFSNIRARNPREGSSGPNRVYRPDSPAARSEPSTNPKAAPGMGALEPRT
jgi:transcriptional regulator with XRE-family HTH domain